jgi:hypothetical protein
VREALDEDFEGYWDVLGTIYNDGKAYPEDRRS